MQIRGKQRKKKEFNLDINLESESSIPQSFWNKQEKRLAAHETKFKNIAKNMKVSLKERQREFNI
jgi:hypothetical protein